MITSRHRFIVPCSVRVETVTTLSLVRQALPGESESEREAGREGQSRGFGVREGQPRERLEGEGEAPRAPQGPRLAPLQQIIRV